MSKKPNGGLAELIEKMKTDTKFRYGITGGILALILIVIIIICVSCSKKDGNGETQEESAVSGDTVSAASGTLEETTNEAVRQLFVTYYKALEVGDSATVETIKTDVTEEEKIKLETKANDIESIGNIKVYTRPGVTDGTYVVFVYCEIKFVGIETVAPSLTTTYVSTREDGSLCMNSSLDDATEAYAKLVASEEVIANYFAQVAADYTNALASDPQLKSYMDSLNDRLDAAVVARQQEAEQAAAEEAVVQTAASTVVNETVIATTKVNVRASDSENADRLGQVEAGTSLTRYETRDNGWSKIDYNGQEGYIKSEFLQAESTNETASEENTEPEQTEETAQESTATVTGKVTAKESVRVRASANESGDLLGMLYQGESCDLIMEQADGWCKISYNGKTGYVKSDYVEIN